MQEAQSTGGLHISLPAQAANVSVIRHALAGMAEEIGMDETALADLKTVVTEACMNVVVHAYDEPGGLLEVEAAREGDSLKVVVRDFGTGIRPDAKRAEGSLRLGLSMIAALSRRFQLSGGQGQGIELSMWIGLATAVDPAPGEAKGDAAPELHMTVEEPPLLKPVLARLIGALAARQDLTVDRLSDAFLLSDALAVEAPRRFGPHPIEVALLDGDGTIDLRLGPMQPGSADALRQRLVLGEDGATLEKLADDFRSESDDRGEYIVAHFATFKNQ